MKVLPASAKSVAVHLATIANHSAPSGFTFHHSDFIDLLRTNGVPVSMDQMKTDRVRGIHLKVLAVYLPEINYQLEDMYKLQLVSVILDGLTEYSAYYVVPTLTLNSLPNVSLHQVGESNG